MASFGLRVNNQNSGTDFAETLSNLLLRNPLDEMKMAQGASSLKTDEAQRAQIQSATDFNILQAKIKAAEEARKAADAAADLAAVGPATQLAIDAQGNVLAVPAAEEPVVVDDGTGAAAVPVPTPRPDVVPAEAVPPEIISTFPSRPAAIATNGPEIPPALQQIMTPPTITGRPDAPALAVQTQAPVSSFPARPAGPQLPMPYEAGPAEVPEISPVPSLPESGNWLDALLMPMGQAAAPSSFPARPAGPQLPMPAQGLPEEPVPVPRVPGEDIPGHPALPMVQPLPFKSTGRPGEPTALTPLLPPTGPIAGRPGGQLPVVAEEPVSLEPLVVPQPQPTAPEARPSTVPPPDPNAAILPAATGDVLPAGAAPPAEQALPGAVVGAKGGKGDTEKTIQTKQGGLPREGVEALVKAIMVGEGTPEAKIQAVQRLMGTLGTTYNPEYGKDAKVTENLAALRAGGASQGKEAASTQLTAEPGVPGAYEGTGIEAQDHNTITSIMANPNPTPEQARSYALAWTRQYGEPRMQRVENEDGTFRDIPVARVVPPGVPTPEAVYKLAGINEPVPTPTTPAPAAPAAPATTETAPAETQAKPATTEPAPAVVEPKPGEPGYIVKRPHEVPTGEQLQNERYYTATKTADADIRTFTKADIPTPAEEMFTNPAKTSGNILREITDKVLRTKNPKLARYWSAVTDFSSAILRDESGAATRPEDLDIVMERYIPLSTDSPAVIEKKNLRRSIAVEALKHSAFPGTNPAQRLAAADALIEEKLGEGALLNEEVKKADEAAAKPSTRSKEDQALIDKYKKNK